MAIQISPYYNREGLIQGSWPVYVDQEVVRFEHTIGLDEGQAKLNQIKAAFPDYVNFDRSEFNVVGSFDAYREPYCNPSISFYDYGVKPATDLLSDHGV